jgi:hypothetical protein
MLPESLEDQILIPFGFLEPERTPRNPGSRDSDTNLADNQLVFLSKSGWLSTLALDLAADGVSAKRHFFLPQDWLDSASLGLVHVTTEGALFCPKDSEVGVIRNGFKHE